MFIKSDWLLGAKQLSTSESSQRFNKRKLLRKFRRYHQFRGLLLLQIIACVELIGFLALNHKIKNQAQNSALNIQKVTPSVSVQPSPKTEIQVNNTLLDHVETLFETPDSLGAIALGVAEGTRTPNGDFTSAYFGHRDFGNAAHNLGTFSYQHGAFSPEEADHKHLKTLRKWVNQMYHNAKNQNLQLSLFEFLAGIDLMNQAPAAGRDYLKHFKTCKIQEKTNYDVVLCARIKSFFNPETGKLEAGGFDNDFERVVADQQRRLIKLQKVLNSEY